LEFAAIAELPVVSETVENRKPPEPDILCEVRGRGRVAFELVDLIDQGLARTTARALRGEEVDACWYGMPPLEAIRRTGRETDGQREVRVVHWANALTDGQPRLCFGRSTRNTFARTKQRRRRLVETVSGTERARVDGAIAGRQPHALAGPRRGAAGSSVP
jgi:hypothetical protein